MKEDRTRATNIALAVKKERKEGGTGNSRKKTRAPSRILASALARKKEREAQIPSSARKRKRRGGCLRERRGLDGFFQAPCSRNSKKRGGSDRRLFLREGKNVPRRKRREKAGQRPSLMRGKKKTRRQEVGDARQYPEKKGGEHPLPRRGKKKGGG